MNPVLLKPHADCNAQLIVGGRVRGTLDAIDFREARGPLLAEVLASYRRLEAACDLVLVEGAGSPAEINLRDGDIANMGFARAADVPVVLVGDIDRGGVIASIVGTRAVLDPQDAAMIRGFVVNRFRGERALFDDGYRAIEERSGWRGFGVVPWLSAAALLPSEDGIVLPPQVPQGDGRVVIACPITPHIANADDLDPLRREPSVDLRLVPPGEPLPTDSALVILVGSKATIADLRAIRREGWDIDILAHHRRGGRVLGLCGGYQMLGRRISDPQGVEGPPGDAVGLGLIDVETVLTPAKTLERVAGQMKGARFEGYEMHMGLTDGPDTARAPGRLDDGRPEGAASKDGRVAGTYVHGLLDLGVQRGAWLAWIGAASEGGDRDTIVDAALDEIAAALERYLDLDGLLDIARRGSAPLHAPR